MRDLVAAFGLALAIEGLLFASFPDAMKRILEEAMESPRDRMRIVGVLTALFGVAIVWATRRLLG
jgi:uncharacterized protein YjeT (DUF2065 family)